MDSKQLEFITSVIGCVANRIGQSPAWVYRALSKAAIISGYLLPAYDVLHTFSRDYVADDVIEFMKEKGVAVC